MENNKKNKDIKIVSGDGKNLDISPVYKHLPISKPKNKQNGKKIVIPNEDKRK